MRELIDRPQEHFALIRRTDTALTSLAVFIHGFRGNYLTTWGSLSQMLHADADNQAVFADWDYLFVGYDTGQVATYLDIAKVVWGQWSKASQGERPYNRNYDRLALLGHSLGTLGIRQALLAHAAQPKNFLSALHGVSYFGSPINGSPLAKFSFSKIAAALEPGSPQLRMLKAWCKDMYAHRPWRDVRVITGTDDAVVGYVAGELMGWDGDLPPTQTGLDHSDLVKPRQWNSQFFDEIHACLR